VSCVWTGSRSCIGRRVSRSSRSGAACRAADPSGQ
jgi:hypothetical protein